MIITAVSDCGLKRKVNEDAYFLSNGPLGMFDEVAILCDGMGGHNFGALAAEKCIEAVSEYISKAPLDNPYYLLERAVNYANRQVNEESKKLEAEKGIGCTLVILAVAGRKVYIVNVGDSRAYLIDDDDFSIRQITRDHSVVEEEIAKGTLVRSSEEYYKKKNIITRAVGFIGRAEPDIYDLPLLSNQYFLMCSDGLSNMVPDIIIKNLVLDESFTLEKRAETLVKAANGNGGKDNITVVLLCTGEVKL